MSPDIPLETSQGWGWTGCRVRAVGRGPQNPHPKDCGYKPEIVSSAYGGRVTTASRENPPCSGSQGGGIKESKFQRPGLGMLGPQPKPRAPGKGCQP